MTPRERAETLQKELDRIECDENQPRLRSLIAIEVAIQQARDAGYVSGLRAARAELETEREEDLREARDKALKEAAHRLLETLISASR